MTSGTPNPEQMRLIATVLSLHFEEGRPQSEIAKAMGMSHAKVNRLIKQGRELGMVQITIRSPLVRLFDLERAMMDRWGLRTCLVVPAVPGSPTSTLNEVGKGAANLLADTLHDGDTIAISPGKSLSALIENFSTAPARNVTVVPMTGGVQDQHYTDVNHLATELARKLEGQATLIHAPLHAESEEERDMLMALRNVREAMDKARDAAVALVGIGAVTGAEPTYFQTRPVSKDERQRLYDSGVRSEFLGYLINQDGALSDDPYNSRLVALTPEEVAGIPMTIAVASGEEKVEPIVAAMNGHYFNGFVTDEITARAVLKKEDSNG